MEFEEAKKAVQAEKAKENYMIIPMGYDTHFLVPYKDGIAIVAALANAEKFIKSYSDKTRISVIDKEDFRPTILSRKEYELIKIANLLQVDVETLKEKNL